MLVLVFCTGMSIFIVLIVGVVAFIAGYAWSKMQVGKVLSEKDILIAELRKEVTYAHSQADSLMAQSQSHHQAIVKDLQAQVLQAKEVSEKRLEALREQHTADRQMWEQRILEMAQHLAQQQSEHLRMANRQQMDELLTPLGQSIQQFKDSYIAGQATARTTIEQLMQRTQTISAEAQALTEALRGNNKKQGNWGEGILENLLQHCGLTAGRDYHTQYSVKGAQGQQLYPDVVVRLPEEACLVIDAKVSLSAFVRYHEATTPEDEQLALKAHVRSVDEHIKVLSAKEYPRYVKGAIGFVLLFIPNEAAYMAAVQADSSLLQRAYAQQVILINPSNLLMTLQLAYHLNQAQQRQQNVDQMFEEARKIYDKFVTFTTTFCSVEQALKRSMQEFAKAKGQLATGKGNIKDRFEGWRALGLTPSKTLDSKTQQLLDTPIDLIDYDTTLSE